MHVAFTWFQVVVDDGWFDLVEVSEGVDYLHDNGASLFLRHQLVLLQIEVEIIPLTELKNSAESRTETHQVIICLTAKTKSGLSEQVTRDSRVSVQGKVVIEFDYSGMVQLLVDSIFSTGMSGVDKITNEHVHERKCETKKEKKKDGQHTCGSSPSSPLSSSC